MDALEGKVPVLSVVVIGRNEGERLARCLESVGRMNACGWDVETIYADSGSRDGSAALAESKGAKVVTVVSDSPTAAGGRNAGWKLGRGELVLFLDGDTEVEPQFFCEALKTLGDVQVGVVWGHRRESNTRGSVYNRVMDLDWMYPAGPAEFCGGDALMRRLALEEAGGFDATLIAGEEPELCRRILGAGFTVVHIDCAMTGHDLGIKSFREYWKRAQRAGHAYAEISRRFAGAGERFWTQESEQNVRHATGLCGLVATGVGGALLARSGWPAAALLLLLAALVMRTAWKARWKSNNAVTLLLYGVHSHLQHVPILWGQWTFWRNKRRGVRSSLVEYKRTS